MPRISVRRRPRPFPRHGDTFTRLRQAEIQGILRPGTRGGRLAKVMRLERCVTQVVDGVLFVLQLHVCEPEGTRHPVDLGQAVAGNVETQDGFVGRVGRDRSQRLVVETNLFLRSINSTNLECQLGGGVGPIRLRPAIQHQIMDVAPADVITQPRRHVDNAIAVIRQGRVDRAFPGRPQFFA